MTLLSSSAYVIHTTTKQVILRRIKDWNDLEMQQNEKRRVRRRKRLQNEQKEDKRTRILHLSSSSEKRLFLIVKS